MIYFGYILDIFCHDFESLEAEDMAKSLFWLSDEAWKTLEPHLPMRK
jgi:hypothetical protein